MKPVLIFSLSVQTSKSFGFADFAEIRIFDIPETCAKADFIKESVLLYKKAVGKKDKLKEIPGSL